MKRIIIIVLFIGVIQVFGEVNLIEVKKLKDQLNKAQEIQKSEILNKLAIAYWWAKSNKITEEYCRKALQLSRNFKQLKQEGFALLSFGNVYWRKQQYKIAYDYAEKGFKIANKFLNEKEKLLFLMKIRDIYGYADEYKKLLKTNRIIAEICKKIGNKKEYAVHIHLIGTALRALNRLNEALFYLKKASELYLELNNYKKHVQMISYISKIYIEFGLNDKALKILNEGEAICKEKGFKDVLCRLYLKKAFFYINLNKINNSIEILKSGLLIASGLSEKNKYYWLVRFNYTLGYSNILIKNYKEAKKHLDSSFKYNGKNNSITKVSFYNIIKIYRGDLLLAEHKKNEAFKLFNEVEKYAKNEKNEFLIEIVSNSLGKYYFKKNNYKKAILYLEKSIKLAKSRKSIYSVKKNFKYLSDVYKKTGNIDKYKKYNKLQKSFKFNMN